MNRNTKTLVRGAVARFPVGVHRWLTRFEIRQLSKHLMNDADIQECENNEASKKEIVQRYERRFPKQAAKAQQRINSEFVRNPRFKDASKRELDILRDDMMFNWFAYGFYPDEFVFYDLAGENRDVKKRRAFVSEVERMCFRFSANDFTNSLFADKAATYRKFAEYYKREAVTVARKEDFEEYKAFVKTHPVFVEKLCSSSRGQGVRLVDIRENNIESYFQELRRKGKVLLEEVIEQHELMKQFNESSVNTVRVSTYTTLGG